MVTIKELTLEPDSYGGIDIRTVMTPISTMKFKLTSGNKCFVKDMPAGTSKKNGKPYQAFKTYSIKCEHNGKEVWARIPNQTIAATIEGMSIGDEFEITCMQHPKGKTFIVEKVED